MKSKEVKVAVCIPTYNREKMIQVAIDSLLAQKNCVFDIHVFDNASTDNTQELLASKYKDKIFYHRNPTNIGYVGNVNRCLSLADKYDWINVFHSDDCHYGESVQTIKKYAQKFSDVGIIFSNNHIMDDHGNIIRKNKGQERIFKRGDEALTRAQGQFPCSSTFYNCKAIKEHGLYSPEFPYSADEEYSARIARNYDILEIEEILSCYRRHEGHTMIKTWKQPDFIESFEKMRLRMNSYLSSDARLSEDQVKKRVAVCLVGQTTALVALGGHRDIVTKFYGYAMRNAPRELLRLKALIRYAIHFTPILGPYLCGKLGTLKRKGVVSP